MPATITVEGRVAGQKRALFPSWDLPLAPESLPSCVTASLPLDTGHVAAAAASPGPCQFRLIAGDHLFT